MSGYVQKLKGLKYAIQNDPLKEAVHVMVHVKVSCPGPARTEFFMYSPVTLDEAVDIVRNADKTFKIL